MKPRKYRFQVLFEGTVEAVEIEPLNESKPRLENEDELTAFLKESFRPDLTDDIELKTKSFSVFPIEPGDSDS